MPLEKYSSHTLNHHSKNGIYLNGQLMEKNQRYILTDNAEIVLAEREIVFRYRTSSSTLPPWQDNPPKEDNSRVHHIESEDETFYKIV